MQQRKTGKCQERLTKHIAQRLPFKSKAGTQSNTHKHRFPIIQLDALYYNNFAKFTYE